MAGIVDNTAALRSDIKLFLKTVAIAYGKAAADAGPKVAKQAIEMFYSSYSPYIYRRTDNLKNNSYERLEYKQDKIDVIVSTKVPKIINNFKNPILLELKNKQIKSESDLEKLIYSQLSYVFLQLGNGFAWIGNQYKVSDGNKNYFIDMLLYNIKYNCYVVVEIKCRKLKKEDKGQVEFYMNLVDKYVKEIGNNPTIGIIITKEQDKFVANFVRSEKLIPLTYELLIEGEKNELFK